MALATLASAISQDIIILMTLPFWSLKFLCHFSAPDFQSHYNNMTSGEMALATLASAISQGIIILIDIAFLVFEVSLSFFSSRFPKSLQ